MPQALFFGRRTIGAEDYDAVILKCTAIVRKFVPEWTVLVKPIARIGRMDKAAQGEARDLSEGNFMPSLRFPLGSGTKRRQFVAFTALLDGAVLTPVAGRMDKASVRLA
jgi:hypothetical protein